MPPSKDTASATPQPPLDYTPLSRPTFQYRATAHPFTPQSLGYPHRVASPQLTEPFWEQFKLIEENADLVRRPSPPPAPQTHSRAYAAQTAGAEPRRRGDTVGVRVDGVLVGNVPLRLLTRFSRVAWETFRNTRDETTPSKRELHLGLDTVNKYPEVQAVRICIDWMFSNQAINGAEPLIQLYESRGEGMRFIQLIDLYAASLSLGLRPPKALRLKEAINKHLTDSKPSLAEIKYINERIPSNDSVITRMVTSSCDYRSSNAYKEEEFQTIKEYVCKFEKLRQHFAEVQEDRLKYHQMSREEYRTVKAKEKAVETWKRLGRESD